MKYTISYMSTAHTMEFAEYTVADMHNLTPLFAYIEDKINRGAQIISVIGGYRK